MGKGIIGRHVRYKGKKWRVSQVSARGKFALRTTASYELRWVWPNEVKFIKGDYTVPPAPGDVVVRSSRGI